MFCNIHTCYQLCGRRKRKGYLEKGCGGRKLIITLVFPLHSCYTHSLPYILGKLLQYNYDDLFYALKLLLLFLFCLFCFIVVFCFCFLLLFLFCFSSKCMNTLILSYSVNVNTLEMCVDYIHVCQVSYVSYRCCCPRVLSSVLQ